MPSSRRLDLRPPNTLIDRNGFKVDEYEFTYRRWDGTPQEQRRLVFERGDAAAVLLLNTDSDAVVLVKQFRLPVLIGRRRDKHATGNGLLIETVAGMVDEDETPEQTIIRETKEETGYSIVDPKLICTFFSSPGGSSERIFLYFAEITNAAKSAPQGGDADEDIAIEEVPISCLFEQLTGNKIEDPKLVIAAYWLHDYVKRQALRTSTVRFQFTGKPERIIGYKTGEIDDVKGVDVWVNSENTVMTMDRFIGRSISAKIRYLGANKDPDGTIHVDTIQDALKQELGARGYVQLGTVLFTGSGMLLNSHGVESIVHVASVEGRPGRGIEGNLNELPNCVKTVLKKIDDKNNSVWRRLSKKLFWKAFRKRYVSILFPMLGAGDGGLKVDVVAQRIIPAAIDHLEQESPTMREIYFLAYKRLDKCACEQVFKHYCDSGTLVRMPSKPSR